MKVHNQTGDGMLPLDPRFVCSSIMINAYVTLAGAGSIACGVAGRTESSGSLLGFCHNSQLADVYRYKQKLRMNGW